MNLKKYNDHKKENRCIFADILQTNITYKSDFVNTNLK